MRITGNRFAGLSNLPPITAKNRQGRNPDVNNKAELPIANIANDLQVNG